MFSDLNGIIIFLSLIFCFSHSHRWLYFILNSYHTNTIKIKTIFDIWLYNRYKSLIETNEIVRNLLINKYSLLSYNDKLRLSYLEEKVGFKYVMEEIELDIGFELKTN